MASLVAASSVVAVLASQSTAVTLPMTTLMLGCCRAGMSENLTQAFLAYSASARASGEPMRWSVL